MYGEPPGGIDFALPEIAPEVDMVEINSDGIPDIAPLAISTSDSVSVRTVESFIKSH